MDADDIRFVRAYFLGSVIIALSALVVGVLSPGLIGQILGALAFLASIGMLVLQWAASPAEHK